MPIFEVTLKDDDRTRGWRDPETMEETDESTLTVDAKDAAAAKVFAEEHNPGLTASDAKAAK